MDDLELSERLRAQSEEINRGAPIPTVGASDMKQVWDATRRINAEMPPKPNSQIGMGALAAYGVDVADRPEELLSVSWRHQLPSFLVERGVLNDYKHGEELDERVSAQLRRCHVTFTTWARQCCRWPSRRLPQRSWQKQKKKCLRVGMILRSQISMESFSIGYATIAEFSSAGENEISWQPDL